MYIIIIITRCLIPPLKFDDSSFQPNTFQLVIAYDPSRYKTYVTYHYLAMGWDNEYTLRRSMIGYLSQKYREKKTLQLAPSMKSTSFRLHKQLGNTGKPHSYLSTVCACARACVCVRVCASVCARVDV